MPPLDVKAIGERTGNAAARFLDARHLRRAGYVFAAQHFNIERMVERISGLYSDRIDRRDR